MDDESGESMELMEEVPLKELGEAELERLVQGWQREAGNWFQRRWVTVTAQRSDLLLVQGLSDKMHQLEHVLMCEIDAHRE